MSMILQIGFTPEGVRNEHFSEGFNLLLRGPTG
jgi:hypothetical protein